MMNRFSKLTAQERAKGEYGNIQRFLNISVCITLLIGLMLTGGLYLSAELIAENIFRDMRTALALKILAAAFPFMAVGGCITKLVKSNMYKKWRIHRLFLL